MSSDASQPGSVVTTCRLNFYRPLILHGLESQTDKLRGDIWRIVRRSIITGLILSVVLGFAAYLMALLIKGDQPLIGVCVAVGLATVVLMANLAGSVLPLLLKRVGLDPAIMSSPFISTLTDIFGLAIYMEMSRIILGLG